MKVQTILAQEKLVVTSSNCTVKNKNWYLIAHWMYLVSAGWFEVTEHLSSLPAHTKLP
jgi:hypothetical protein